MDTKYQQITDPCPRIPNQRFLIISECPIKMVFMARVVPDIQLAGYPAFFDIRYPAKKTV